MKTEHAKPIDDVQAYQKDAEKCYVLGGW